MADLRRRMGNPKSRKNVVHNGLSCCAYPCGRKAGNNGGNPNGVHDANGFFFNACRFRRSSGGGTAVTVAGAAAGTAI